MEKQKPRLQITIKSCRSSLNSYPLWVTLHVNQNFTRFTKKHIFFKNPSNEDIESLHSRYVSELTKLYSEYNPVYGDVNVKLVIT